MRYGSMLAGSCSVSHSIFLEMQDVSVEAELIVAFAGHRPYQDPLRATRSYRSGTSTALRPGKLLARIQMFTFAHVPFFRIRFEAAITSWSCARPGIQMAAPTSSITATNV